MYVAIVSNKGVSGSEAVSAGGWQKVESDDVLVTLSREIENRLD